MAMFSILRSISGPSLRQREPMPTLGSAMAMGYRYPPRSHSGGREERERERERDRERAVVALNASKEMETQSVEWALSNVACHPGDRIILLAILSSAPANAGKKLWGMPLLSGDCRRAEVVVQTNPMGQDRLSASASQTIHRLCKLCHAKEVNVEVRVVPEVANGITTAMEAAKLGATWVVLDGQLKKEAKWCTEQLSCNVVLVDRSNAKILRLNLNPASVSDQFMPSKWDMSHKKGAAEASTATSTSPDLGGPSSSSSTTTNTSSSEPGMSPALPLPLPLPAPASAFSSASSSWRPSVGDSAHRHSFVPELRTTRQEDTASDTGAVAEVISDYDSDDSYPVSESPEATPHSIPFYAKRADNVLRAVKKQSLSRADKEGYRREVSMVPRPCSASSSRQDRVIDLISPLPLMDSGRLSFGSWKEASGQGKFAGFNQEDKMKSTAHLHLCRQSSARRGEGATKRVVTTKDLLEKLNQWDQEGLRKEKDLPEYTSSSVRQVTALTRKMPAGPPPLCSICQHKVPIFGKPPRRFGYAELEVATAGFSRANFLAEGGFGSVHRGVLPDGQPVAVKQHKPASSQGDVEFCAEVEVLSCAQHRNVVMLIGYCVEENHRLLVYEFICNGSLDSHLYGKSKSTLEWSSRQKIALGAVRGLRYLHEECRVGCIVHRDMRPNNILLTHDFEPMVGDFGLARWQPNGDLGEQTRVIGTFGYLAPEYIQSGEITEKADVYSFGVVLLELVTGRKAIDINRPKGQQCLTEWARPLLVELAIQDLIDPALGGWYSNYEVYCMLHAASLCISKDPHLRPRMSQVLRILEGDIILDMNGSSKLNFGRKSFSTDPALSYHQRSDHVLLPPPVDYSAWPWIHS